MVCDYEKFTDDFDILDIISSSVMESGITFSEGGAVPCIGPATENSELYDMDTIADQNNNNYYDIQCIYSPPQNFSLAYSDQSAADINDSPFDIIDGEELDINLWTKLCEDAGEMEDIIDLNKCKISTTKQLFQNIPACTETDEPFILRGTGYEPYIKAERCNSTSSVDALDLNKENYRKPIEDEELQKKEKHRKSTSRQKKGRKIERTRKNKHKKMREQPNRCYHLWDFLNDLLIGRIYPDSTCTAWVNKDEKEFRILDTKEMAKLWGICKNSKNMTYDKLSRTIRYYCTLDILKKIEGRRLQFKFGNGKMWTKNI